MDPALFGVFGMGGGSGGGRRVRPCMDRHTGKGFRGPARRHPQLTGPAIPKTPNKAGPTGCPPSQPAHFLHLGGALT